MRGYYYKSGEHEIKGPFKSLAAVKKQILVEAKECFDSSCNCMKTDPNVNWFEDVQIFHRVGVFRPMVKSNLKLEEVQP